jgi:hypothetical protein
MGCVGAEVGSELGANRQTRRRHADLQANRETAKNIDPTGKDRVVARTSGTTVDSMQ